MTETSSLLNNEKRNLRKEIEELGIVSIEDLGLGGRDSAFAALDAVREHNKKFPKEKLEAMIKNAQQEHKEA